MKLKSNNYFTKTYEIVEGVLQGESLSPLLFSIFIADMESYFYSLGLNGINVDNYISVLLLFFADDLVILADSKIDLNRKLKALNEYCIQNHLTVNINKTKVMIFSKGGYSAISRRHKFYYDSSELDIVPVYSQKCLIALY